MSNRRKLRPASGNRAFMNAYRSALACGHCTGRYERGSQGPGIYHDPGCPVLYGTVSFRGAAFRAIADAAEATEHVVIPVEEILQEDAGEEERPSGLLTLRVTEPYFAGMRTRTMRFCRHLGPGKKPEHSQRALWAAWDGVARCTACFTAVCWRTWETPEDSRCDSCGKFVKKIRPATVITAETVLTWGMCEDCCEADLESAISDAA
jgi:hypothetical protein